MPLSAYATPRHVAVAGNYLSASAFLLSAPEAERPLSRFSEPAHFLVAHGAELTLKAYLSWSGMSQSDVEAFGHDLAKAYQKIRTQNPILAKELEKEVSERWRRYLREARSADVGALAGYGITSPDSLASLGIPSNADIGNFCPTFAHDLQWLSDRHKSKGGKFRYVQFGVDRTPTIQGFGLDECTVPKTVRWGCEYLLNILEKQLRNQQP